MLRFLGPTGQLAVLEMDLDNFKAVNDTLGHRAGDEALRLFFSVVRKVVNFKGDVYRRGGDEVLAFAPELDPTAARTLAEEIRAEVEAKFREWGAPKGLEKPPTTSVGLVLTSGGGKRDRVIVLMDQAQRQAKGEGKNRVVCAR